ncbi:MAG: hypothetical protein H7235_10290 [Bdellovibrionaceae bacterium]|nr:hypothetical protein [Pseudobdellovibrionaceae bacterium]
MKTKNLVLAIMGGMVLVVVLKIGLLFTTNKELNRDELPVDQITSSLPVELEVLKNKITDSSLTDQERFIAIDAITRHADKDLAIVTLEKLEETQKTTAIGDRLRRAVVALRFNKPVEELKKNEKPSSSY